MKQEGTLLLTRSDVAALLGMDDCIAAVEHAFGLYAEGRTAPPGVLGVHAREGGFHIKAGLLDLNRYYFAAKANANFPGNPSRFGLPTIQGVIVLCDAENGYPLALMDSMEITTIRTGAATAIAAKYLARSESETATVCGCGNQGRISVKALMAVLPIKRVYAFDADEGAADRFSKELSGELQIEVTQTRDLATALAKSDVCVTCTPSKTAYLSRDYVVPGTFIAAVGADNEEKQELDPALMKDNKIVVDVLQQCAAIGDLHHALQLGLITEADVHAELGDVISGKKPARESADEIIIFDSTGMALQD
ncbi:MAG: ornithine cyclodeaminase family protein, partial [Blastocatellia bacterium]